MCVAVRSDDLEDCSFVSKLCVMELLDNVFYNIISDLIILIGGFLLSSLLKKIQFSPWLAMAGLKKNL